MTGAVRGVLFDLDDTLLDDERATRSGLDRLLARCPGADRVAASRAWDDVCREHFPRYVAGELTFDESRAARIRAWADRMEITVEPGTELTWFGTYRAGYEAGWAAFSDVAACLRDLDGMPLGVVTNGDGDQQRAKLAAIGLGDVFDTVIASGEAGCAKPDPRIFHLAAAGLRLEPGQCLFIGDRWDVDVLGALAAGMRALWLNRRDSEAPDDLAPEITSLAELPALLLRLTGRMGRA